MKRISPILICLFLFQLHSCNTDHIPIVDLTDIENLITINNDSAYSLLNKTYPSEYTSQFDQAYYYIVLSEINHKKSNYTLVNDSLLDIAIQFFKNRHDNLLLGKALLNKSRIWAGLHHCENALNYYHESLNAIKKANDSELLATVYFEIANVYLDKCMFHEAIDKFHESYRLDSMNDNTGNMIITLGKMGQAYLSLEKPEDAVSCFDRSYNIAANHKDSLDYLGFIFDCYSIYYNLIGENQLSLDYMSKSMRYSKGDEENYHKCLIMGEVFFSLQQYDSARHYLSKSVTSANIYTRTAGYSLLYELEKAQGNLKAAIDCLAEYQKEIDSTIGNLHQSETKKLPEQHRIEKAFFEANAKHKITVWVLITLFIALLLVIVIYSILKNKKSRVHEEEKEQEILKKEKEIKGLTHKMKMMQADWSEMNRLQEVATHYEKQIKNKKEELHLLFKRNIDSCCEDFRKQPIYLKIKELSIQKKDKQIKILTYQEQARLNGVIKKIFSRFIRELKNSFPTLTDDDITLCCLSLTHLSTYSISLCFTVSGSNTIKQRRHRIKNKMTKDPENSFLYDFIFS